jgi:hypothetical protein
MIAKHIPMRAARRSSFQELVAYITHAKDKMVRVGEVRVTNCHQEDAQDAVLEVLATQLQNKRAGSDKTYHLLISFDAGDQPSPRALRNIEDELCQALGFGEHQRVSAVHMDTDNLHIHVAINKIHPKHLTIHNPYGDYKALAAVCQSLEQAHDLVPTNHEAIARGAHSAALDMEHAAGMESLLGWIRRECLGDLRAAQSWRALHQALGQSGLVLREQGNGFIVSDQEGRAVKASSIARDLSKAQLEKRLGPFEADGQKQIQAARAVRAMRTYSPRPMPAKGRGEEEGQGGTEELYRRYQAEQDRNRQARSRVRRELRQQKQSQLSQAKEKARARRGLIRGLECDSLSRRLLYRQAGAGLREDVQAVHGQHRAQWELLLDPLKPLAWFDWLAARAAMNDRQALAALRQRRHRAQRKANCLLGMRQGGVGQGRGEEGTEGGGFEVGHGVFPGLKIDGVTRQGTIIYSDGESAIRDSGSRLEVSEGIKQEGLEIALAMAIKRFGGNIAIEGDATFRERVLHTARALRLDVGITDRVSQAEARPLPYGLQERDEVKERDGAKEREQTHAGSIEQARRTAHHAEGANRDSGNPGLEAAGRYIAERELKRQKIAGIPRHILGELKPRAEIIYAGWRRVDRQYLLLARSSQEEVAVIPVDAAVIVRAARARRGEVIRLDAHSLDRSRGLTR